LSDFSLKFTSAMASATTGAISPDPLPLRPKLIGYLRVDDR
jgi:hypothetical protein